MTLIGLHRSEDHQYTYGDGTTVWGPYPGVTSAVELATPKQPLIIWARRLVADFAVEHFTTFSDLIATGGVDQARPWLANEPERQRRKAADRGTDIHGVIAAIARGDAPELTDENRPSAEAYVRFLEDYQPKLVSVEHSVINRKYGYGGSYDLICRLDGALWLIDAKTSKGIYSGTALQLAAYGNAEFIAVEDDPKQWPMPPIQRYAVLHLSALYEKGYELIEYDVGRQEFVAFLAALKLLKWMREASPIGAPVPVRGVKKRVPKEAVA
jgi:hypothetical protein